MPVALVFDDDVRERTFLNFVLDEGGFTVLEASSGWEAIELIQKNPGGIALALLGVESPGVEQLQTLAVIQKAYPDVPCCLLTQNFPASALRSLKPSAVFPKPIFDSAKFIRDVRQLAGLRPQVSFPWPVTEPFPSALRGRRIGPKKPAR